MKLEIRGLRKVYTDGTVAVDRIDLAFESGMLGLLGPNGAGKTTFLSMLTLGVEPTGGRIRFDDLDAGRRRDRSRIRRLLGYLPQRFQPVPDLSALEYLRLCGRLRSLPGSRRSLDRRAMELLEVVGLADVADRRAGTFSGGMKQRLGIAQAVLHAPSLVVVDEPTAGLDPEERIRFRQLVTELAETTLVILSTHILEDVEATCPRLAVIAHGELRFDGAPTELLRRVHGRLWEVAAGEPLPAGAAPLGQRIGRDGSVLQVVYSPEPPPSGAPRLPRLEDGYAYFLGLHGRKAA